MLLLQAPTIPARSSRNLQRVFLRCLFPAHERDTSCVLIYYHDIIWRKKQQQLDGLPSSVISLSYWEKLENRAFSQNLRFLAKIRGFYKIRGFLQKIRGFLQKICGFLPQNQSCSKLPETDKSVVKKISLILGGGLFCHKNQSCSKLPETDKSAVKKISLIGGGFSATKTKVARNRLKRINLQSKKFPSFWGGGGGFSATKTKVARNCLKLINLRSKNFPHLGGGGFSATKTKVARNCLKRINLW